MKHYEQKLQATRQILTEGMGDIKPEQFEIALMTDRKWVPLMFPLPMHCIAEGIPKEIYLKFSEFQELAPIVMKQELALLQELSKLH